MATPQFITVGKETGKIPVRISYRIIELFSDGLYSSPSKAIEELVSNAFDAGATNVHVILSPDRSEADATIIVADDGEGMDEAGLKQHWLIGISNKRALEKPPKGRKQIGKFGIGKLATFVLARYLTHISKRDGKYYAVTMDYQEIPQGEGGGIHTEKSVSLPLRELTEEQAQTALSSVLSGDKPGYKAVKLFGKRASPSWTVAIMSGLKDFALELQKGRLTWVLRTAMPLRDDFALFLDGDALTPSKGNGKRLKKWVLGDDLKELPGPAPDDLDATEDPNADDEHRYGLTHPKLGRVTGYAEIYKDPLTGGKSDATSRSHGFFVYVNGRLINATDALFGLPALHYGTFARFRMVVHMDGLDDELRSSREAVREGALVIIARSILYGVFNHVRTWLNEHEKSEQGGIRATDRIAGSPWSLTRRPILSLVESAFAGKVSPRYLVCPPIVEKPRQQDFLAKIRDRASTDEGLVLKVELTELSQYSGIASFDVESGTLRINTLHPFVAAFREDYEGEQETLSLLAMAEVLTEAHLYELGLDASQVNDAMKRRDEILRQFARSTKRTANQIAQDLIDASSDKNALEEELVAAFDSMGFNAVRIGGKGKPDGKAEAPLGAQHGYAISLEAKSKEDPKKKVSAHTVNVSLVAQHRNEQACDHAVVVAPDFPTTGGETASLIKQAKSDKHYPNKTITFVRIIDLARLVRLVALKGGVSLERLRDLFKTCVTPEEATAWIDKLDNEPLRKPDFKAILDTVWELQREEPSVSVEFAAVKTSLRLTQKKSIEPEELIEMCKALSMIVPHQVTVREGRYVEIHQRPDKILATASSALALFPSNEQKKSIFAIQLSKKPHG